jgi:hypothetical protein
LILYPLSASVPTVSLIQYKMSLKGRGDSNTR